MANFSSTENGKSDFVLLNDVSMDSFMSNLKLRYQNGKIYTYIGEVVVSVNPYRPMNIYERAFIHDYKGKEMYEREPHIFALADAAYRNMKRTGVDCCVIISGKERKRYIHICTCIVACIYCLLTPCTCTWPLIWPLIWLLGNLLCLLYFHCFSCILSTECEIIMLGGNCIQQQLTHNIRHIKK